MSSRQKDEHAGSRVGQTEERRAADFRRTREARQAELAEDYVELIAELIAEVGEARSVDIARRLGVSVATVVTTIRRLQRDGLVTSVPYRSVFLTERGRTLAERCQQRHTIVVNFLLSLGISDVNAHRDAEGMEHYVSDETLRVFSRLTRAPRS